MKYQIELLTGYIKATLSDRQADEETRQLWDAVLDALRQHNVGRVLLSVKQSKAVLDVENFGFTTVLAQLAVMNRAKVALVSDTDAVAASHAAIERIASQRGLQIKAFRDEQAAAAWLTGD